MAAKTWVQDRLAVQLGQAGTAAPADLDPQVPELELATLALVLAPEMEKNGSSTTLLHNKFSFTLVVRFPGEKGPIKRALNFLPRREASAIGSLKGIPRLEIYPICTEDLPTGNTMRLRLDSL